MTKNYKLVSVGTLNLSDTNLGVACPKNLTLLRPWDRCHKVGDRSDRARDRSDRARNRSDRARDRSKNQ